MKSTIYTYPDACNQASCYPISIKLDSGQYIFECYGASGGDVSPAIGGKGAYTSGIIQIHKRTQFFLFIGAHGHKEANQIAFNGGGRSSLLISGSSSGGGGTDVRLINSSDFLGLSSRIIVSAGGGGSDSYLSGVNGGSGGTLSGFPGIVVSNKYTYSISISTGGTQTSGGDKGKCITSADSDFSKYSGENGQFGSGGRASDIYYGGGGGGGYFGGGGGGGVTNDRVGLGAGGSSFISGHTGCLAIDPRSSYANPSMLNHSFHSSGLFFVNTIMKGGNETFFDAFGNLETGHFGNGFIKITLLSTMACDTRKYQLCNNILIFLLSVNIFLSN